MTEENERYWIVFNGEIYNYRELRTDLEKRGWYFRTRSDTEVLLRSYQEYGETVLSHLNGQFAFAIWDRVNHKLFAARDRFGEKPLYWAISDRGHILLASEIRALLATGLIRPKLSRVSVDAYLSLLYVPPDRTIYENVKTLPPGCALSWQEGRIKRWRYWEPKYSSGTRLDPVEIVERLRFLIDRAVQRQMVADVPVGAFLSGGLDSSTIVALMTQHASQPVMTFSVGFGNLINELPYARAVADAYHTDHHQLQMDIRVGEMLERMVEVYDEPFADSSNIPTYLVAECARRHVKVVLSGDGGDEMFGGYEWYRPLLMGDRPGPVDVALLRVLALSLRALAKAGLPVQLRRDSARRASDWATHWRRYPDFWERHVAQSTTLKHDRSTLWNGHAPQETEHVLQDAYAPNCKVEGIDRATDFDIRCYLPGDILVKVDRAAMAHGLETRAPFLDVDLVEFTLSLPWRLRFQDGVLKYLLRQACSELWPTEVRLRAKQGFGAPIERWITEPDVQSQWQRVTKKGSGLVALLPGVRSLDFRWSPQHVWTALCLGLWLEKRPECLYSLS